MKKIISKSNKDLEIKWLGLDGFLVALYFIIAGIIFYGITAKNDFIIGKLIPYAVMISVTLIFLDYLRYVFKFLKKKDS